MKRRSLAEMDADEFSTPTPYAPGPEKGTAPSRRATVPVGMARKTFYLRPQTFQDAKAAYVADFDRLPDPPRTFALWISHVLSVHSELSPQERADLARKFARAETTTEGVNRGFTIANDVVSAMDAAIGADRRAGTSLQRSSRSNFAEEALRVAIAAAQERVPGGVLPPAPARLPNGMH